VKPVGVGDMPFEPPGAVCAMPLYLSAVSRGGERGDREDYMYFMRVSMTSEPPSEEYIRWRMGDMSDWRIDWRTSTMVAA